jgi:hypothetical protein
MVKIKVPEERESVYHLHGGGHDGSTFTCGPGLPNTPPTVLVVEDDKFVWRYEHTLRIYDDDGETYGAYALVSEHRK